MISRRRQFESVSNRRSHQRLAQIDLASSAVCRRCERRNGGCGRWRRGLRFGELAPLAGATLASRGRRPTTTTCPDIKWLSNELAMPMGGLELIDLAIPRLAAPRAAVERPARLQGWCWSKSGRHGISAVDSARASQLLPQKRPAAVASRHAANAPPAQLKTAKLARKLVKQRLQPASSNC